MTEITITGLIPAAGASRRMGRDKRRLPFRGRTVLEVTVDSLRRGGVESLVVVLEDASPCRDLPGLADVRFAINPDPDRGMLSSIRVGLSALDESVDAAAVLPGDHPFVPPEAVAALMARFVETRSSLLVPRYPTGAKAKRGHPLIIARALFADAMACDDDQGLRQLLSRRADVLEVVDLDFADADDDLDTPEDLARLGR